MSRTLRHFDFIHVSGQVYKALRGGVQDVAVKQLLQQEDGHLEEFIKVQLVVAHAAIFL